MKEKRTWRGWKAKSPRYNRMEGHSRWCPSQPATLNEINARYIYLQTQFHEHRECMFVEKKRMYTRTPTSIYNTHLQML